MKTLLNSVLLFLFILISCNGVPQAQKVKTINNPVLPGFYPDPSICRVGGDFYLVNSTFSYFPGVPVFHSRDLVNWKQVGNILDRPSQLNIVGLGVSEGIFAPTIRYHDGVFYMITTLIGGGGNFFVTAENPAGPWSDPTWLPEIDGIDPSFFFDDNGRVFIVSNGPPPGKQPLYDGHCAIWLQEFDLKTQKLFGERKFIVNGGTDLSKKPVWIEGPHILKKDGFYFLIAAEGGTEENHSEVVFRSSDVWGPWEPYPGNPILTQRSLPASRPAPVTCTGHADFVETPSGEWWAVFLGCRPYEPAEKNFFNTGRETFMAPVNWETGWPVIGEKSNPLLPAYPAPKLPEYKSEGYTPLNNCFPVTDHFDSGKLAFYWNFLRTPTENWYSINKTEGTLEIGLRPEPLSGRGNPSFIGRRQQHTFCEASVSMSFSPAGSSESAGLAVFQNEQHFYSLVKTVSGNKTILRLMKAGEILSEKELGENSTPIELKIVAKGKNYDFLYRFPGGGWSVLAENIDGSFLSTRVAGGFVGAYFGMYACGPKGNNAVFDWFDYSAGNK